MTDQTTRQGHKLAALRAKIDAVDESVHGLLMQRAGVIDELIRVKGAATRKGAAFRPDREAAMMEILAARHSGSIPFGTIAHLWREIISTFTWMQAPYGVHLAAGGDQCDAVRDLARFQFGFTVPVTRHQCAADALERTAGEENAIAMIAARDEALWWEQLGAHSGLFIMARLPIHDMPFEAPVSYCVAPALSDPAPFDVRLYAATIETTKAASLGALVQESRDQGDGMQAVLIGLRNGEKAPPGLLDIRAIGGYFAPDINLVSGA